MNIVAVRREDVRPREDRLRAGRRAPARRLPDVPRRRQEVPRGARHLRRLPSQGRQAQGRAGPEVRRLPHRKLNWKDARFDHGKTRFALTRQARRRRRARTATRTTSSRTRRRTCVGCHRKDDKQHRGRLGEKCEACHTAQRLERRRGVPARPRHASTRCAASIARRSARAATRPSAPRDKLPTTCIGCHKADDKHNATLGTACGDCHTERNWREAKFDHDLSVFKLRGKHRDVECKECHRDPKSYKGAPQTCIGCHRKDDTHKDRYGEKCATLPHRR